jgi:hypothetical protein
MAEFYHARRRRLYLNGAMPAGRQTDSGCIGGRTPRISRQPGQDLLFNFNILNTSRPTLTDLPLQNTAASRPARTGQPSV